MRPAYLKTGQTSVYARSSLFLDYHSVKVCFKAAVLLPSLGGLVVGNQLAKIALEKVYLSFRALMASPLFITNIL